MKTMKERKIKLETLCEMVEYLEGLIKNTYEWEKSYRGFDTGDIENWSTEDKEKFEELNYKIAVVQSWINQIENTKI